MHETGIREIPRGSTNLRRQKQKELTWDVEIEIGWVTRGDCSEGVADTFGEGTEDEDEEEAARDLFAMAVDVGDADDGCDTKGNTHDYGGGETWVVAEEIVGC